jgi:hypothetical protein
LSVPIQYASFLIRIWQENKVEEASPSADWHAEVEHIQSSQRWMFKTVEELLIFLRQQAENIPVDDHLNVKKPSLRETLLKR